MPFAPGDPWPSATPGGVARAEWGGYVKFWLLAEISPGTPLIVGPDPHDRLDAGNVIGDAGTLAGGGPTDPGTLPVTSGLWVDLTCDCVDVDWQGGASSPSGVLTKVDAGQLTAKLWDPTGKYDPLNPDSPFALGNHSRLRAGVRILAMSETIVNPTVVTPTVLTRNHFTGTVDKWSEPWTKEPGERFATVYATDIVKDLNRLNRAEQPAVGDGDQVFTRLGRIATYFGFTAPTGFGSLSSRTLQATTLAQSAWELLNRAVDDDLGFLYINGNGALIYQSDAVWTWLGSGTGVDLEIGCDDPGMLDIVVDATPSDVDKDQINQVTAARTGGSETTISAATSVAQFGEKSYKRTDLGLATDPQAAGWAERLVALSAYPRTTVDDITMIPAVDDQPWLAFARIFDFTPASSIVRLAFRTPRFDYQIDELARMVGWRNTVTASAWSVTWTTVAANMASGADILTVGPDPFDRLDAGNVIG